MYLFQAHFVFSVRESAIKQVNDFIREPDHCMPNVVDSSNPNSPEFPQLAQTLVRVAFIHYYHCY
jgi:hypothetical protein